MSYVDDLVGRKPEIRPFSQFITNNLADNYVKGLGEKSKYRNRLSRGIEVATQTAAEDLPAIIQGLISDRMAKSADTRVTSGEIATLSEGQQRVLILALWSSRIPKINRDGKIDIENTRVYGNENSMPPVNLSIAPRLITNNSPKSQSHEPTLEEFEIFLRSFPRNREISIDDAFDAFEQQYTENGRALRSGWQKRLEEKLTQSKRT